MIYNSCNYAKGNWKQKKDEWEMTGNHNWKESGKRFKDKNRGEHGSSAEHLAEYRPGHQAGEAGAGFFPPQQLQ